MNKNNKKNKTVKELNVVVEELNTKISSLEVDLRIIQSKLKEMFNKKDNRMVQTQSTNTRVIENKLTCNQCDIKFKTQSEMTLHLNEKHKTPYKCKICEYEGTTLISMESHIISEHKSENILKCNDCEKSFASEIRLKKHSKKHSIGMKIKFCHYYNNGKECPYQKFGCKFRHSFPPTCNWKLCQFSHRIQSSNERLSVNVENTECDESYHYQSD